MLSTCCSFGGLDRANLRCAVRRFGHITFRAASLRRLAIPTHTHCSAIAWGVCSGGPRPRYVALSRLKRRRSPHRECYQVHCLWSLCGMGNDSGRKGGPLFDRATVRATLLVDASSVWPPKVRPSVSAQPASGALLQHRLGRPPGCPSDRYMPLPMGRRGRRRTVLLTQAMRIAPQIPSISCPITITRTKAAGHAALRFQLADSSSSG